jgi:hypothetical protein
VKLLLDEHLSPALAASLRSRGHDAVAVSERGELRTAKDIDVLVAAAGEQRVVVTQDIGDFMRLGARRLPDQRWHRGVVLAAPRTFPTSRDGSGLLIRALDVLLAAHPGDDDLVGEVVWLKRAPDDRIAE